MLIADPAHERRAEALAIQQFYGRDAPLFIASRLGALAEVGDAAGVARFKEIAAQLDELMRTMRQ